MTILIDVFPIHFDENYQLSAFEINASNSNSIGAVFASKIRTALEVPAVWVKSEEILVVSASVTIEQLNTVLKSLWESKLEGFEHVNSINQVAGWLPTPESQSQFITIGILGHTFPQL